MTDNNGPRVEDLGGQAAPQVDKHFQPGLALLRQSYLYAQDANADLWDFAVENVELYDRALTISDLRWLVAKQFAEHGKETSFYGDPHRSFRRSHGLNFVPSTCFVLTARGVDFAARFLQEIAATP